MKIIGFSFSKLSVERNETKQEKININQDIDIKDVIKEKIPISKDEVLKIEKEISLSKESINKLIERML